MEATPRKNCVMIQRLKKKAENEDNSGKFHFSYGGRLTGNIPYDPTATMQRAGDALPARSASRDLQIPPGEG